MSSEQEIKELKKTIDLAREGFALIISRPEDVSVVKIAYDYLRKVRY